MLQIGLGALPSKTCFLEKLRQPFGSPPEFSRTRPGQQVWPGAATESCEVQLPLGFRQRRTSGRKCQCIERLKRPGVMKGKMHFSFDFIIEYIGKIQVFETFTAFGGAGTEKPFQIDENRNAKHVRCRTSCWRSPWVKTYTDLYSIYIINVLLGSFGDHLL